MPITSCRACNRHRSSWKTRGHSVKAGCISPYDASAHRRHRLLHHHHSARFLVNCRVKGGRSIEVLYFVPLMMRWALSYHNGCAVLPSALTHAADGRCQQDDSGERRYNQDVLVLDAERLFQQTGLFHSMITVRYCTLLYCCTVS